MTVTTFMVLGGVLVAFLVAVMPAAPTSGTPSTVATEPVADPAATLDPADGPQPIPPGNTTDPTRTVAVAAVGAVVLAGVGFLVLRKRRRTSA